MGTWGRGRGDVGSKTTYDDSMDTFDNLIHHSRPKYHPVGRKTVGMFITQFSDFKYKGI